MKINPSIALAVASAAMIAVSNGATTIGDLSLSTSGLPGVLTLRSNGNPTVSLTGANSFVLPSWTLSSASGLFGAPGTFTPSFTAVSVNYSGPSPVFVLSDPSFGLFTATSVSVSAAGNSQTLTFSGNYSQGTYTGGTPATTSFPSVVAEMIISLNQAGGSGNNIGVVGTFAVTDINPIPEPGSALATAGLLVGGMFLRRRKQQA